MSIKGIGEIELISEQTGVKVQTICADYLMEAPLHSEIRPIAEQSSRVIKKLLKHSALLGVTDIVIPCVDQSSLTGAGKIECFLDNLTPLLHLADKYAINLSLETDLDPQAFVKLLDCFDSNRVTVNYDIGNSAALGYDPIEELDAYGEKITDIHIKDRKLGGGPVILGTGDANFDRFFDKLKEFDYQGPFIMQAYRDNEGLSIFKKQLKWISKYIN
jgi:L-ribulose-5-phosphate 3-epimerase